MYMGFMYIHDQRLIMQSETIEVLEEPLPVWLSWLGVIQQASLWFDSQSGHMAWVAGLVPASL